MSRFTDRARTALAVVLAAISLTVLSDIPVVPRAAAVSAADWEPGAIITDNLFFDSASMSVAQIQSFMDGKVATCTTGYTCLKSYIENPTTKANNIGGATVEGGWSSAQIIKYAADTSRISPRSLLVLLQKESGLVTKTAPTSTTYRTATGFGCPDTAPCDAQYFGFYNQVTQAAAAFRRYADNPTRYRYQAGAATAIYWHPDLERCGSRNVAIQNQATAGLYIYTPYQPNAASVAAYPGTGDSCSSYGNRNFWYLWNNWFGSTAALPPGNGGQAVTHSGGRCIDVPASSVLLGTQVQLWQCSGAAQQQWKYTIAEELRVYGQPERCLDVRGMNFAAGTAVQLWECNGSAAQKWSVNPSGTITIRGFCLDGAGGGAANGTGLVISSCTGSSSQRWSGPAVANGGRSVQQSAGRCIDVPDKSTNLGTRLQLWDCTPGVDQQQWVHSAASELRVYANECLDLPGLNLAAGTPVQIWACTGGAAQKWSVNPNGTITIQGYCLDGAGGATGNGISLVINSCNGGTSQRWAGPAIANGGKALQHLGGRCADVPAMATLLGSQVQLWDCSGAAQQQWLYSAASELRMYANECLDLPGLTLVAGTAVQLWACNGNAAQKWSVNADGTIGIQGFCLDTAGAATGNGTRLVINSCNGGPTQRWAGPAIANGGKAVQQSAGRCIDVPDATTNLSVQVQLSDCTGGAAQQWRYSAASELRVYANECLDVRGMTFAAGTPVQVWGCNGNVAQKWTVNANGTIGIQGYCLDGAGGGTGARTGLVINTCNGSGSQRWAGPAIANGGTAVKQSGGRCVDVPAMSTYQGTQVHLWDCSGAAQQQWQYTSASELRVYANECLDVRGGSFVAGTPVQVWGCNGNVAQKWSVNANGTITIRGLCLDGAGSGSGNGTPLVVNACNGSGSQRWSGPAPASPAALFHPQGGRCVDVTGVSATPGTLVQLWDCHGGPSQAWTPTAAGELRVYGSTTPRCLDAKDMRFAPGTPVQIWECNGNAAQRWSANADGTVTIHGLCLDATGYGTTNGTRLQLWSCNGGTAQRWVWQAT